MLDTSHQDRAKKLAALLPKYHDERTTQGFIPRYSLAGDDILIAAEFIGYGLASFNDEPVAYLREVDGGTDNACWVVCSKGDPGCRAVFLHD